MRAPIRSSSGERSRIPTRSVFGALALIGLALAAQPALAANLEKLGRECREGKQKACEELAKIATQDKNSNARESAARLLTDQTLLVRIAQQDRDLGVRRAAVSKLNGTSALELLKTLSAEGSDDGIVAGEALDAIQDPSLQFQAALDCKSARLRLSAATRLADQALLSRLALESSDAAVRSESVRKLTGQQAIETVARSGKDPATRVAALWKLTDSTALESIAKNDTDETVRNAAKAASDWKTIQAGHDVYVWKPPSASATGNSVARLKISAILGGDDMSSQIVLAAEKTFGENAFAGRTVSSLALSSTNQNVPTGGIAQATFGNSGMAKQMASASISAVRLLDAIQNPEGPGYVPWWFQPESDQDVCVLAFDNVAVTGGSTLLQAQLSGSFTFIPRVADGKGVWAATNGQNYLFLQSKLHINPSGSLALAGTSAVFAYTPGSGGPLTMTATVLADLQVKVSGTIRFPKDRWTPAGAGFEIQAGGLQFDETGVFFMAGTKYRKHPQ
jgi:hypothetical protein